MGPAKSLLIFFISAFLHVVFCQEIRNKICVENNYDRGACQQISRSQEFACTETEDIVSKVDCFINIDNGEPQFSIVTGDEAFLAAPLVSERVTVVSEIKPENAPYQTTVIIRKPYDGSFENLRGKRFCHPGFKHDELISRPVLEELEYKVLNNIGYCNSNDTVTLLEKRVRALASFFGSSCRPGPWTESDELDTLLKSTYPSLCNLCGTEKCAINYQVPFNDTLQCLTQKGGDIALTTLRDALVFFNRSDNANNYQYLCPNGSVNDAFNPCTWTNQINRLIVTGREFTATVRKYLEDNLANHVSNATPANAPLTASLETVLKLEKTDRLSLLANPVALKTFVEGVRSISSNETATCNTTIKWCNLNDLEQQKCLWLQRAAINSGLVPTVECRKTSANESLLCLNYVGSGDADITFNDVNYGYSALKKGLSIVAYTETDTRQLSQILIVVRNDSTNINSLKDLQGKRACFPEYGGKEWLAFIDILRSKSVMRNSCDYGALFSDFVGESCVPGARESDYDIENTNQDKLCYQCIPVESIGPAAYCNADYGNKYYGSDGALTCLVHSAADYAVITRNDVIQYQNDSSMFRVLSKNGSLSQLTGINVDENAPLTIITAGGVVAQRNSSKKDDIVLFLRGVESEFGLNLWKTFKVFEKFNNTKDLLFPDSTPGLTFGGTQIKYVDNFKQLLSNSEMCIINNSNIGALTVPSTLLMAVFAFLILRF